MGSQKNPNMHKITVAFACLLAIATASLVPGLKDKKVEGKFFYMNFYTFFNDGEIVLNEFGKIFLFLKNERYSEITLC